MAQVYGALIVLRCDMTPTEDQLVDFVIAEARMVDELRLDDWLNLFTEDGIYWMPLEWQQSEEHLTTSLMYEDMLLLRTRVERLKSDRTFSQKPKSRCHHVLQRPTVDETDHANNRYLMYTPFHYIEIRYDDQTLLAGWARHTLKMVDGELKIKRKRVDLVNCDAPHRNIQLFP